MWRKVLGLAADQPPCMCAGRLCGRAVRDANNDNTLQATETLGVGEIAVGLLLGGSMVRSVVTSTANATLGSWCHYITQPGAQTVALSFTAPPGMVISVPMPAQSFALAADGVLDKTVPAVGVALVGELGWSRTTHAHAG